MFTSIPSLDPILQCLLPVFTQPSFQTHIEVLLGWVMCLSNGRVRTESSPALSDEPAREIVPNGLRQVRSYRKYRSLRQGFPRPSRFASSRRPQRPNCSTTVPWGRMPSESESSFESLSITIVWSQSWLDRRTGDSRYGGLYESLGSNGGYGGASGARRRRSPHVAGHLLNWPGHPACSRNRISPAGSLGRRHRHFADRRRLGLEDRGSEDDVEDSQF